MELSKLNYSLVFLCLIGLGLSIYSYIVELAIENDENYSAMCDISEHMSCTKAFKSQYGKGFGIAAKVFGKDSFLDKPNSLAGIIFYSLMALAVQFNSQIINSLTLYATILSNISSIYFASILYFVLHDLCIVCVTIYFVNILLLFLVYKKGSKIASISESKGSKVKSN